MISSFYRDVKSKKEGSLTEWLSSLSTQHQPMLSNKQTLCQNTNLEQ
ncbi:hypothetical protein PEPS_33720 (plasmid) [Persicobacter psychrovividus]|uniref:Uncharacterized protein n=1 Tax=Persicobacter psychrovividus TaxID=387638 RepID=A0ABM7VJC6_9BACT|nr:hypothetical protein PEPS_33720 [Persicobacter psychrovividus]